MRDEWSVLGSIHGPVLQEDFERAIAEHMRMVSQNKRRTLAVLLLKHMRQRRHECVLNEAPRW